MLETTRKRGAGILIYSVFGMLIVIFVFSFGSPAGGQGQGCTSTSSKTMVTVGGSDYGMSTWRWAYNTRGGGSYEGRTTAALDKLIRRELLAQEAERRGLIVGNGTVDEKIKAGEIYVMGEYVDGKTLYFEDGEFFNYKLLMSNIVQRFGLSIGGFKNEQRRELMAQAMEEVLKSGGHASQDEAYSTWLHEELSATVDAVTFQVEDFARNMILTDADVDRFLAGHLDEVKAKYETDKALYAKTPASVRVRRVMIKKTEAPPQADDAPEPATPFVDPGKKAIEDARADIVAKKKTFVEIASALDADEATRARGGDLGWKSAESPDLPTPDLADALKKLTAGGEPSAVVTTADAYWLLAVDEKREGDLTFDQVKREIASKLAVEVWSKEGAKRAAIAALHEGKTAIGAGKTLEDIFERAPEPQQQPQMDPEQIRQLLDDPSLSPEVKQQLEQYLQMMQSGQGSIGTWESKDIAAEWQAAEQADEPAAAGAAAPVGDAPVGDAPVGDAIAPSKDTLPKFADAGKPMVARVGPVPREREKVSQIGKAPELVKALFDELENGEMAERIYEVKSSTVGPDGREIGGGTAYVVVQLIERAKPDPASFAKEADGILQQIETSRGQDIVRDWLTTRCNELVVKKEIRIHDDVLVTKDDKGVTSQITYGACSNL